MNELIRLPACGSRGTKSPVRLEWGQCVSALISELMQMVHVYWQIPIPKRMPMCATSSNQWKLAIVISAGEGSVCRIAAKSLITRS